MSAHTPRHPRRKGSEPMDATPQPAPVQEAPRQEDYTAEDLAVLDLSNLGPGRPDHHFTDDDLDRKAQDRRADDARKADDVKRQVERQADTRKAVLAFEDRGEDRRRQAEEAARRERQADERHRQEVAADNRDAVTARNVAQVAAATRKAKKHEAEADRKPVEVFDKIDAKKIAATVEDMTKLSIGGLLLAFAKGFRETAARVLDYVTAYMTPPMEPLRAAMPAMPWSQSLPEPEAVLAPSGETKRKPTPAPAAPAPVKAFEPRTQADRDFIERRDWNPLQARQEGAEIYGSPAFFAGIARSLETGFVSPYDEDAIGLKAPHLVTLLSGGYGQDALQDAQARFADLQHRLKDDVHAAYKLAPSLMDRAVQLENAPEPDFEMDDTPRDPPDDGAPVFQDDAPEITDDPFMPPAPSPAPSPSPSMRRTM